MDYSELRDALQQGDFQLADDLTRAALITLAGPDAEKRNWVYFTEVKFIANTDLQTIDNLWRAASKNRWCCGSSRQAQMHTLLLLQSLCISAARVTVQLFVHTSCFVCAGRGSAFRKKCGCKTPSNGQSFSSRLIGQLVSSTTTANGLKTSHMTCLQRRVIYR